MDISLDCSDPFLSCSSSSSASDSSFKSIDRPLIELLDDTLSDVRKNFNVVHINAQSIPAHFSDMLASFDIKNLHAILISETFLNPCLSSVSYSLPGFQLIRNDRVSSSHGGVAIYLRSHISFSILSRSPQPPPSNSAEHLLIEVCLAHTKVLLGVFYSPSLRVDYFESLEQLLENFAPSFSHTIIMGDFNTCLIKDDIRAKKLMSVVNSSNLHILPLKATHHFPKCTPSLLDLMIVSSPTLAAKHGQYSADAFSYHDLVYLSYRIRPPKLKPTVQLHRGFNSIDQDRLIEDATNMDWSAIFSSNSVDEQVDHFNRLLIELYDKHAPLRPVKIKHLPAPWLTDELRKFMAKRDRCKAKFKLDPSNRNEIKYNRTRNRCNTVIRDAQRRHIHKSLENEDPNKQWKFLKSLGIGKSHNNSPNFNVDINQLNCHFCSSTPIDSDSKAQTLQNLSNLPTPDSFFILHQFADCDVKRTILSVNSTAVGVNSISRKMILPILDVLLPIITHILNTSVLTGTFPAAWKDANVTPLPKKPNPTIFSEFRPISILPFLSKVLEKLVHHQLNFYLNTNNLFNPFQSGFRKGHSTATALVKITDDIRQGMENRQLTILTLLDFSNAFNSVDYDILLGVLRSLNISPAAIDWFQSYLLGRRQRIRLGDSFSGWCDISAGVPQGGVLSPLLFSIFINTITDSISSSYHLYADDLQIYTQAPLSELQCAVAVTNSDLAQIDNWSKSFGLTVNPSKTQTVIIGSPYFVSRIDFEQLPAVIFDGTTIPYSKSVRNLGVIFDQNLSWRPQVDAVRKKIFGAYSSLNRLRNFLPISTKITLAQSLMLSIIDYGDVCYTDLSEELLDKMERLQNVCIRFIFNLRKFDHVSHFRSKLNWLPIRRRRDLHALTLLYSTLFLPTSPPYLKDCFSFHSSALHCTLRSSSNLSLNIPQHSTDFFSYSFTVHAVRLWNSLPESIRKAKTPRSFGDQVRSFFLSSAPD